METAAFTFLLLSVFSPLNMFDFFPPRLFQSLVTVKSAENRCLQLIAELQPLNEEVPSPAILIVMMVTFLTVHPLFLLRLIRGQSEGAWEQEVIIPEF